MPTFRLLSAAFIFFFSIAVQHLRAEPLLVAIQDNFPPFTYKNDMGEPAGLHYEITMGVLRHAGFATKVSSVNWARIVAWTDRGQFDVSAPWRDKKERFEKYNMIGPFTETGSRSFFFGRKGTTISWQKVIDLKKYTIGIVRDFAYAPVWEDVKSQMKTMKSSVDTVQLAKMLYRHRVDLIISDETNFWLAARELGLAGEFEAVGRALDHTRRYLVVPKQKPELAKIIAKAMSEFKTTAAYKNILKKYNILQE